MTNEDAKQKLILAGQVLVNEGQDDFTRGHISVRVPDMVTGTSRRHSEVYIHSEIYQARADVACVLHTHPPYAVALSASGQPLKCYSQPGALFYEAVGLYNATINLIRTPEMGAGVATALGSKRAVLLKNHGIAVAGGTIEEVVVSALMLENSARIQMIVEAAGNPGPEFPRADIEQLQRDIGRPDQFVVNFDYLVRRAQRRNRESSPDGAKRNPG